MSRSTFQNAIQKRLGDLLKSRVECDDEKRLEEFKRKAEENLALDGSGDLTYIAPTRVNLDLTMERWPEIEFRATREK